MKLVSGQVNLGYIVGRFYKIDTGIKTDELKAIK
jgi:hypothetical protein